MANEFDAFFIGVQSGLTRLRPRDDSGHDGAPPFHFSLTFIRLFRSGATDIQLSARRSLAKMVQTETCGSLITVAARPPGGSQLRPRARRNGTDLRIASPRILLTGGAGFIGSHVAEALLRHGAQLAILDNLDDFYSPAWKQANLREVGLCGDFEFFSTDLCDPAALRHAIEGFRPDVVIHLAARAGVRPSLEQPQLYERINVGGTANLLDLCRRCGVQRFLFGSSSSVYGVGHRVPFSEDQGGLRPISPYAATKLAGETLCRSFAGRAGTPVVCLRFFTVYGPRQRPDLAIHKFTALLEADQPIPIYGDGSTGRDYTWIGDIVAGILAALDYEPKPAPGAAPFEVFNLGNSHPVKLTKLIEHLERATGRRARRLQEPEQKGDVPLTWADINKARRLLGYAPSISLQDGLERFVAWFRTAEASRRLDVASPVSVPIA